MTGESPTGRKVIVQIVSIDATGDSLHRMHWPAEQLAKQCPDWLVINLDASAVERFAWGEAADLLVLYQSGDLDLLPILRRRQSRGLKTIVEYNDNFYEPPPSSPAFVHWRSSSLQSNYETFLRSADGVMTTSSSLVDLFRTRTSKPCHRIRNHLPVQPSSLPTILTSKPVAFSLCWAGSIGHAADLIAAVPVVQKFLESHQDARLHLMGNAALPDVVRVKPEQLHFQEWGDMNAYFKFLGNAHVGIVSLISTPYNMCRSDVKAIEMTSAGVLPLLPAAAPYEEFIAATSIPTWESFDELYALLENYHRDRKALERDLTRCFDYVTAERIGNFQLERKNLYETYLTHAGANPATPWPDRAGFYHVKGSPSVGSLLRERERSIRSKLQRGDVKEGLAAISLLLGDYQDEPSVAVNCLAILRENSLLREYSELCMRFERQFPQDRRFLLCRLRILSSQGNSRIDEWKNVLRAIPSWSAVDRSSWMEEIVSLFIATADDIRSHEAESWTELCSLLELVYPESFILKAHIAKRALASGDADGTRRCNELADLFHLFSRNQAFFKEYTEGYWRSFAAGNDFSRRGHLGWRDS